MNIAVLSPEAVVPANTGGRIVVYNKIKYLHELGHRIYLFCITDSDVESSIQTNEICLIVEECHNYNRNSYKLNNVLHALSLPYATASRTNSELIKDLQALISREQIDLIDVEFPQMAQNVIKSSVSKKIKCVLSEHNIEYRSMHSIALTMQNPIQKAVYLLDSRRLRSYEEKLIRSNRFDGYTFVSSDDMKFFQREHRNLQEKCHLVPIGAEDHRMDVSDNPRNIVIVGKMSYKPNVEGVLWFYNNAWPFIRKKCPKTNVYIVGKDPDQSLLDINDDRVKVTGTVDSVEPYYKDSCVAVIPIFAGGGVKTKLIEASSHRMPIVCTPQSTTGTEFAHLKQCFISKDPEEFSDYIIEAINRSERSNEIAKQGYKLFCDNYTWKSICIDLSKYLEEIVRGQNENRN